MNNISTNKIDNKIREVKENLYQVKQGKLVSYNLRFKGIFNTK